VILASGALALLATLGIDWAATRAGLLPPGFHPQRPSGIWRRAAVNGLLCLVLWLAVFAPLTSLGRTDAPPPQEGPLWGLFALHALFALFLVVWVLLGYDAGQRANELGLQTPRPGVEIGLGLAAGLGAWLAVIASLVVVGLTLVALGRDDLLPAEPPTVVPWIASLPVALRLGVSLSAGLFEELFFRGFLQTRSGVVVSTALFVLAHSSYQQPLMLVGISMLSLIFAALVWWRRNLLAAIVAHAVFDAVQLLIVVPRAVDLMGFLGPA
jgi:membrane protease YdiL (CAAX protease family)